MVELGISTFGEITELEGTGQTYSHAERIRQLVAEIELADKVGLDVYGIGEHHRADLQYQPQRLSWPLGQSIPRKSV
ncbi:flavin monoxygenase [Streptococcus pneumoniae]|nr:flavin monoxygenase [Streptococcus pneumoniae]VSQ68535.1 flavin monoxygenase [Streptococcus pneumoniae]